MEYGYSAIRKKYPQLRPRQAALCVQAFEFDGVEVGKSEWWHAEALIALGLCKWVSGARGPGGRFKRLEVEGE